MTRRRSRDARLALGALVDATEHRACGQEVAEATGIPAGRVYAILRRFEDEGLVDGAWERVDAGLQPRAPRYVYRLNAEGRRAARLASAPGPRGRWGACTPGFAAS